MVVGVCRFVLSIPGSQTLKEKRSRIRPILHALHHDHHVSVAEVDLQNVSDQAVLAFALVSNDRRVVNSEIDRILARVETLGDIVLGESDFEIVNY
jgi:uncharacterized protein YlxP (DUF503 family)